MLLLLRTCFRLSFALFSGMIQTRIMHACQLQDRVGWAFGLGLERLAMVLFDIPDIRLFWSTDPRFLNQFSGNNIVKFQPFSKFPACFKDMAFWVPKADPTAVSPVDGSPLAPFHENDLMAIIRDVGGDVSRTLLSHVRPSPC